MFLPLKKKRNHLQNNKIFKEAKKKDALKFGLVYEHQNEI